MTTRTQNHLHGQRAAGPGRITRWLATRIAVLLAVGFGLSFAANRPTAEAADSNEPVQVIAITWEAPGSSMLLPISNADELLVSQAINAPFDMSGMLWDSGLPESAWIQIQSANGEWGEWTFLETELDHGSDDPDDRRGSSVVFSGDSAGVRFLVQGNIGGAEAMLISTGGLEAVPTAKADESGEPNAIDTSILHAAATAGDSSGDFVRSREVWDTTGCQRPDADPHYSTAKAIVIHHTAGANGYSQSAVSGIIRGICAFHVDGRGWDDIGYNFLIDAYGGIWEGRTGSKDHPVGGAHTFGFNSQTQGVALIGDHVATAPTNASISSLDNLLEWMTERFFIHPQDTTTLRVVVDGPKFSEGDLVSTHTIVGHRDLGATTCPGAILYGRLGGIRAPLTERDAAPPGWFGDVAIDFNGDTRTDIASITSAETWQYSSAGGAGWTGLTAPSLPLHQMRAGDFDGDRRTDVFSRDDEGVWRVSFAGTSGWSDLAKSSVPLQELRFGDFDGDRRTDIFSRDDEGVWRVSYRGTSLWSDLAKSSVPLHQLRFGDFDGDGKTDVFTRTSSGRWRVSYGATSLWSDLAKSSVPLHQLRFGDFDGDGKTDVFTRTSSGRWRVSYGATSLWSDLAKSSVPLHQLRFGDFDGDGKTDVFTRTSSGRWRASYGGKSKWTDMAVSEVPLKDIRIW